MISTKKLSDIAVIYNGNSINKTVKQEKYMNDVPGWNYIGTKDINFDGKITYKTGVIIPFSETKFRTAPAGSVFVCSEGGSAGKKTALVKEEVCFGNKLFAIVNKNDEFIPKYIYYYTRYDAFLRQFKSMASTLMGGITVKNFGNIEIPVPPLPEQERIVARIEELFSELDKAIETLKTTKQRLAAYRQAVLKEAFTGTLTYYWRQNNPCLNASTTLQSIKNSNRTVGRFDLIEDISLPQLPSSWEWISIGEISTGAEYGTSSKSKKTGIVPVLRMGNIRNGLFDWNDLVYTNDKAEIEKYMLHNGDVLFNRTNSPELVGKTAVFRGEYQAIYAGYLIRINQVSQINPHYLAFFLNSCIAKSYGNKVKTDGVNQSNINSKKLYSYPFPLCSKQEQDKIVLELESRLSCCDQIEITIEQSLQQAEAMRQSILKQAFEGGL